MKQPTHQPAHQPTHQPTSPDGVIQSDAGAFEALDACHRQISAQLVQLQRLADLLASEGVTQETRGMAKSIHDFFSSTARNHHLDEEGHVFPVLLQSRDDSLRHAVLTLQQDHGWLEENWLELAPQLDAVAKGYSWYDLDALRPSIEVFAALYRDHVALEESLIYPEAKQRLGLKAMSNMGREMAARRRQGAESRPN